MGVRSNFDLMPTLNHLIRFMIHVRLIHTNIEVAHTNIEAICIDHEVNRAVRSGHQIDLSAFNILFTLIQILTKSLSTPLVVRDAYSCLKLRF